MLIGLFKTAMFLFPFIRELFLGKETGPDTVPRPPDTPAQRFLKKLVIGVGCFSLALNAFMLNRLFKLGSEHVMLKREIAQLRSPNAQVALRARDLGDARAAFEAAQEALRLKGRIVAIQTPPPHDPEPDTADTVPPPPLVTAPAPRPPAPASAHRVASVRKRPLPPETSPAAAERQRILNREVERLRQLDTLY